MLRCSYRDRLRLAYDAVPRPREQALAGRWSNLAEFYLLGEARGACYEEACVPATFAGDALADLALHYAITTSDAAARSWLIGHEMISLVSRQPLQYQSKAMERIGKRRIWVALVVQG